MSQLACTPAEELLSLAILQPEYIRVYGFTPISLRSAATKSVSWQNL